MTAFTRFFQFKHGATRHHFTAVAQEFAQDLFDVEQTWLAIDQSHHVDAEAVLQLRHFVQLVEHDFCIFIALKLDYHAHARFIRLIAQIRHAFQDFFTHQFADFFDQFGFVHLVRDFINDDGFAVWIFWQRLNVGFTTHHHAAAACAVAFTHATQTINRGTRRKVGGGNQVYDFIDAQIRIV